MRKIHYGWVVLALGILVVAGSLGFGRFGYSMILPSMQSALGLPHGQTGIIASANMAGYVTSALVAGILASRFGPRMVIVVSLLWTGLTMALTSIAGGLSSLALLRFLTGLGSAGGNISIMGLASGWFSSKRRGMACGFLVGGSGLALTVTGWLVPNINKIYLQEGWRYSWLALGLITVIIGVLSGLFLRNNPREKGLSPVGGEDPAAVLGGEEKRYLSIKDILMLKGVPGMAAAYFCFGFSYIIYATFFVNYIIGEKGFSEAAAGSVWSLVGFLSIGSAVLWGTASDLIGRRPALVAVFILQAVCFVLPVHAMGQSIIKVSAIIFGLTAWSIPGIVASLSGDLSGPENAPAVLGLVTFFMGMGQVMGPTVASYVKEVSCTFNGAFYLASSMAVAGAALSMAIRLK
ncbi:MAG: YbfB/YjiJ family MFS transporter [Bacillota bacterium]